MTADTADLRSVLCARCSTTRQPGLEPGWLKLHLLTLYCAKAQRNQKLRRYVCHHDQEVPYLGFLPECVKCQNTVRCNKADASNQNQCSKRASLMKEYLDCADCHQHDDDFIGNDRVFHFLGGADKLEQAVSDNGGDGTADEQGGNMKGKNEEGKRHDKADMSYQEACQSQFEATGVGYVQEKYIPYPAKDQRQNDGNKDCCRSCKIDCQNQGNKAALQYGLQHSPLEKCRNQIHQGNGSKRQQ